MMLIVEMKRRNKKSMKQSHRRDYAFVLKISYNGKWNEEYGSEAVVIEVR